MGYLVIGLAVAAIIAGVAVGAWLAARRRKALGEWAAAHGLIFRPDEDAEMETRLGGFDCLCQGDRRYAYNGMEGLWDGRSFVGFDYHYQTYSHDSKGHRQTHHHHFSAVALGCDWPLKDLFIRPETFFDKLKEFVGLEDINFESAEFSRKFFVKASDRRWAYDVLHARAIEWLLGRPAFCIQFAGDKALAWHNARFKPDEFTAAAETVDGLLDLLPDYLVRQLKEGKESG
jgi:hypothetical protein